MKYLISFFLTFLLVSFAIAENTPNSSDENFNYIIELIDIEKGKFKKNKPSNEFQKIMTECTNELNDLNSETTVKVSKIGEIEFTSYSELKQINRISTLKSNLQKFRQIRKSHYDKLDILLKKYRKKTNKSAEKNNYLEGTAAFYIEQLENRYVNDLLNFYDFTIYNHSSIVFTKDQVIIEDNILRGLFNEYLERAVKSTGVYTESLTKGAQIIAKTIKEIQNKK